MQRGVIVKGNNKTDAGTDSIQEEKGFVVYSRKAFGIKIPIGAFIIMHPAMVYII